MRYRMEVSEDDLIVRNVETDIRLGSVVPFRMKDPNDPNRPIIFGCSVLNKDDDEIATISTTTVPNPLEMAPVAIANHEAASGYLGLKDGVKNSDPHRIEWRLGTLLADAAGLIARAVVEYQSGGSKAETKSKYADVMAELHAIWFASRFGSFDGERRAFDPYFVNSADDPRMSFSAAAQHYGMFELRQRFPDESETTLKRALSWPLDKLTELINIGPLRPDHIRN
jgi:hypothetical protein